LAPGSKFADLIGEIDPAKLVAGTSMGVEESLHFGLIPKMHRGLFAINELPELDELIQVGLFNLLEERDIQIRGLPLRYDLDVLVLFSANPATYNRSGKVIPQLKDRIGSLIRTHYPKDRDLGIEIMEQEAAMDLGGSFPVLVPQFMKEICEEVTVQARKSKYVDHASGVSARLSISNYRTMIGSARHRSIVLNERPAVPRISDLGHLVTSSLGKIELDLMSGNQMSETQVLDAVLAEAIGKVFREYVTRHGLEELIDGFAQGIKVEVGDMVPAAQYRDRLEHIPSIWDKAFEVSAAVEPAVQASCVEFVLAGLHSLDKISRSTHFGGSTYQL
jgi:magnesium chelatase subunit I